MDQASSQANARSESEIINSFCWFPVFLTSPHAKELWMISGPFSTNDWKLFVISACDTCAKVGIQQELAGHGGADPY